MEQTPADRLLLVDDNPTNLQVLFQALESEGYELLVAQTGEEAIATATEARPQLILLDINMPGIDGYETCRRLKADRQTQDAVVIFLSARGNVEDRVKGLEVGAVDYIGKPFQFEEVVARVRKHLGTYHQQRLLQEKNLALQSQLAGGFPDLSDKDIESLVASGEGDRVEFKSTLRWNLHTNKPDKRIENASLKTIAAYMNSHGGVLLIGVDDQGKALGLQKDQLANEDKLLLHWNGLIKTCLGVEFTGLVRSSVRDLGGQRVLVAQCVPSPEPVFLRRDKDEQFFVRTGNGSQALKPSEILAYLQQRLSGSSSDLLPSAREGRRLGQYVIDKKIGTGSMGIVYRGHHVMLQRPIAIKVLDANKTDARTIARFEREVQQTSQLNHPNTIAIYDYGRTSEELFYYVMEYLDGLTLEELALQHDPPPEARVVFILHQLCGSLAEAHSAGLIHRDIKPANVMLNARGGLFDFVKLLDFGLVKATDSAAETTLTADGALTGTPLYMSPEAIERADQVDMRSDIYSLGAVGYHLLAGRPVFEGRSIIEICMKHAREEPSPPSEKRGQPVTEGLEGLILQCLEKDRERRPQTASELQKSLTSCETYGHWTQDEAAAWWQKELSRRSRKQ